VRQRVYSLKPGPGDPKREGVSVMTTLMSEMAIPKPRPESETAPNASTRLMMPRVEPAESLTAKLLVAQQSKAEDKEGEATDLLLRGIVDRLPKPGAAWPLEERAKWLRTAASIFDLVYKAGNGEQRDIAVSLAKRDA
jgi:hypothetical protein